MLNNMFSRIHSLRFHSLTILYYLTLLNVNGISFKEDMTITPEEKPKLEEFRIIMNASLSHDYMREDIFLIKWLRSRELDVKKAEKMLRNNLEWRRKNKMDTVLEEDFGNMVQDYPYTYDGIDYEGRPVLTFSVSDWDIRKVVLMGLMDKFLRYASSAYERAARKIRQLRNDGKNVTQFLLLCDFGGFNEKQHVCAQCLDIFTSFIQSCAINYPLLADKVIVIKTPSEFQSLLNGLWRATLSKAMNDWIWLLGTNPKIWKTKLLELIPADQLTEEFGGTKPD